MISRPRRQPPLVGFEVESVLDRTARLKDRGPAGPLGLVRLDPAGDGRQRRVAAEIDAGETEVPGVVGQQDADRPEPRTEELAAVERVGLLVRQAGRDVDTVFALAERHQVLEGDLGLAFVPEDDGDLDPRFETRFRRHREGEPRGQGRGRGQPAVDEQGQEGQGRRETHPRAVVERETHDRRLGPGRPARSAEHDRLQPGQGRSPGLGEGGNGGRRRGQDQRDQDDRERAARGPAHRDHPGPPSGPSPPG